jgi:hypothetical protein
MKHCDLELTIFAYSRYCVIPIQQSEARVQEKVVMIKQ